MASSLLVSYSGISESVRLDELVEIINNFNFSTLLDVSYIESKAAPWEQVAMSAIWRSCNSINNISAHEVEPIRKKRFVYYFHTKGTSHYTENWRQDEFGYSEAINWRKYMECFLIEKPTLCLRAMLYHGADTCGVNFRYQPRFHYSGNIWAASCDYIKSLPPDPDLNLDFGAEMWIGTRIQDINLTRNVNLFDTAASFNIDTPGFGKLLPESYRNITYHLHDGDNSDLWVEYIAGIK